MKRVLHLLIFLFVSTILFAHCSNKNLNTRYEQVKDGIIVKTNPGFVKLEVYAENIIRVIVSPEDNLSEKESLMVIKYPDQKVKWNVSEEGDEISLITDRLIAKLNIKNNQVSFFEKSGQLILGGADHTFESAEVMGEFVYHIRQNYKFRPPRPIFENQLYTGCLA